MKSLDKRPNNKYDKDFLKKNNDFQPKIYKHPEKVYLKEVFEYNGNREKMRKYNKRTGLFDMYLNRTRTNKFYINANKEENNINNNNEKENLNNRLKTSNNSLSSKKGNNESGQYKKKNLFINLNRGNSTGNNYRNENNNKLNNKNANDDEISLDEMINFVLEKENEKKKKKFNITSNAINSRKALEQKKQIVYSLNDPYNPYSALFYNNMLGSNYNVGMHYNYYEQGVPHLRIKKFKKSSLPPVNKESNINKERILNNTYSSGFNFNKKKKMIILPSKPELNTKSSSKKSKNNFDSYIKKDIGANSLFQNNKDVNDNNRESSGNEENNEIKISENKE
jgi:hypothetical protein